MEQVINHLSRYLEEEDPGDVLGLYVTGSAALGGLRPNSDIDLVLVTSRSLSRTERQGLLTLLLRISGPPASGVRPVELTSVTVSDIVPWTYPPMCDLLYGEWLRDTFERGAVPQPHVSPDLAVMLTALLRRFQVFQGPSPGDLIGPIPDEDLRQAILDSLRSLLADFAGDERNVLLTLARMLITMSSGEIVSKDEAARRIRRDLPEPDRSVLSDAASGYLGLVRDDWSGCQRQARATAEHLASRIQTSCADSR